MLGLVKLNYFTTTYILLHNFHCEGLIYETSRKRDFRLIYVSLSLLIRSLRVHVLRVEEPGDLQLALRDVERVVQVADVVRVREAVVVDQVGTEFMLLQIF